MDLVNFLRKAYSKVDFGHTKILGAIFSQVNPYYYVLPYLMITIGMIGCDMEPLWLIK